MDKPTTYFNFVPANNKVPCGGFSVVGGGIIGKDYYDINTIDEMRFLVLVDAKDCHVYDYTDSSNDTTSKRIWSNKVRVFAVNNFLINKTTYEYLIANPQAKKDDIQKIVLSSTKSYNAKDLLNFYCPAKFGIECIGGIENNEENQADGHLAFAKFCASVENEIKTILDDNFNKNASISDSDETVTIDQIDLTPRDIPSEEEIVNNLSDAPKGLYFYLNGALLIADAQKTE